MVFFNDEGPVTVVIHLCEIDVELYRIKTAGKRLYVLIVSIQVYLSMMF